MFASLILSLTCAQGSTAPDPASLQYLADFVATAPGEDELGQGAANAVSKRMAAMTFIGAVLDAHGNQERFDQARVEVLEMVRNDLQKKSAGGIGGFTGWLNPFRLLYLVEHSLQTNTDPDALLLQTLVDGIESDQNGEGGWGHTGGNMVSFYPSTLVATTNLNLLALGLAKSFGAKVDQEGIDAGFDLLATVQGANGGMPYGGPAYRKGYEAGRTAASMLAYAAHGMTDSEQYRKAAQYVAQNLKYIPLGHASTAMHLYYGSLAAQLLAPGLQQEFDEAVLTRIRKARTADGSFDDVIDGSPDTMLAFNDKGKFIDRAYVSALSVGALQADQCKWVKRLVPQPPTSAQPPAKPGALTLPQATWVAANSKVKNVRFLGDTIATDGGNGELTWYARQNGESLATTPAPELAEGLNRESKLYAVGDYLLHACEDQPEGEISPFSGEVKDVAAGTYTLRRVSADGVQWSRQFSNLASKIRRLDGELHLLMQNGAYLVLDSSTGKTKSNWSIGQQMINVDMAPHADGKVTISTENRVQHLEDEGWEVWTKRTKGDRGITPPAWTSLLADGDRLYLAESRGEVQCRQLEDGKGIWRNMLGGSIRGVSHLKALPGHLLVVSSDGRVHALNADDGETLWSTLYSFGDESNQPLNMVQDGDSLWLHHAEAERLLKIRVADGEVTGLLGLEEGATWALDAGQLILVADEQLKSISL